MVEFAFMSPEQLSPKGDKIVEEARDKILKNWDSYPPELQDQYRIHLSRFERKAPCTELVLLKGLFSRPSTRHRIMRHLT